MAALTAVDVEVSAARLRSGEVSDGEFDALYATTWQDVSARYWTPVDVATIAARWLTEAGAKRVLDVGSGVGKVCLIGAAITKATFVGIEQRFALVMAARAAAQVLNVERRTMFIHAEASISLMRGYSALYLFNPFGENLYSTAGQLDQRVTLGKERYCQDLSLVEEVLRLMPPGGRVVTYHGFGGRLPDNMDIAREEPIGSDVLRLWIKTERAAAGNFIETDGGLVHLPANLLERTAGGH
ncbi:MAG: hypothetical protein HOW73_28640 [Polyangiaceae bacterium]|nr:hypothetical protein [Polyangiaceae bacterium]